MCTEVSMEVQGTFSDQISYVLKMGRSKRGVSGLSKWGSILSPLGNRRDFSYICM